MTMKTIQECQEEERKLALCIVHTDLDRPITCWKPVLLDRAAVDDKNFINPTIKQLLPYITFTRTIDGMTCVLTYLRGDGGAESRLHSKRSVGIGGHVDTNEADWERNGPNMLAAETIREIYEEIGGTLSGNSSTEYWSTRSRIHDAVLNALTKRPHEFSSHYVDVRYAPVDAVHLGLSIVIDLDSLELNLNAESEEKDQIVDLRWVALTDFEDPNYGLQYEGWSRHVMGKLTGYIYLHANKDCYREPLTETMPKPFPRYGT